MEKFLIFKGKGKVDLVDENKMEEKLICDRCLGERKLDIDKSKTPRRSGRCYNCEAIGLWYKIGFELVGKEDEPKFNLKTIYSKNLSPKEIARYISKLLDKELQFIILPTSEKTCDIIIRDIPTK